MIDKHGRFFMAQSSVSYIISITWLSNSIPEPSKRAVAIAFINAFASLGDIGAPCVLELLANLGMLTAYLDTFG